MDFLEMDRLMGAVAVVLPIVDWDRSDIVHP